MAIIPIEQWSFKTTALAIIFLPLLLFSMAHQHSGCKIRPPIFMHCFQGESMGLAFGKPMIRIVLHFINNIMKIDGALERI